MKYLEARVKDIGCYSDLAMSLSTFLLEVIRIMNKSKEENTCREIHALLFNCESQRPLNIIAKKRCMEQEED